MDQNYVQRYHTATSAKEAARSVWLCVKLYIPISLLFFIIGSALYAYYAQHPDLIETIRLQAAAERLPASATESEIGTLAATLPAEDYGDKVMPHFMVSMVPVGLLGLVISTEDIFKRYIRRNSTNKQTLRVLFITTAVFGVLGIITGISMIGVKSILDVWWELSGIFAGGMLGLFLLGIISKKANNSDAAVAVIAGVLAILWMTFSYLIPEQYGYLRYPLHANMIIVVGTLVISLVGSGLARIRASSAA